MQLTVIYTTVTDVSEAEKIAQVLLDEKLAVCINIWPQIRTMYRDQGTVTRCNEASMFVKTSQALANRAVKCIASLHSYDIPCIITLSTFAVHQPYLQWMRDTLSDDLEVLSS